ncbi:Ankyrin repeat protein [Tolypocladium capitatum]|uniref:Ankyrin repeat protein n=1 Tax=Tolypocladium capitatum TaxID=45235 RepID=A0A2K3QMX8_9HYPO|nr:Ankyrin repeat protein [Tolypocladium capitatum]
MDGFSVTSVTSLCSSIANRAAYSAGELDSLGAARPESIRALTERIGQINRGASQLGQALNGAAYISPQLQDVLKDALAAGDATTGKLQKQVMRLQAENLAAVDGDYAEAYGRSLGTYSRLFDYLSEVLSLNDGAQQDASLNSAEGQEVVEQASISFNVTSQANGILLDGGQGPDPSNWTLRTKKQPGDDGPPPYMAAPAWSSSNTAQAGPSSGGGLSSLAMSIKAFASNFTTKPDPLASALCQAVLRGDTQHVGGLLAQGASVAGRNEDGRTPLQCAVAADQDEAARVLLAAGASHKGKGGWSGTPPLFQAASAGSLGVAQVLLERGAQVDEESVGGQPYFVDVCEDGNLAGIDFLLRNGAKPTWQSMSGRPVLVQAVKRGKAELAKMLLDYGADANCSDITGSPVLVLATEKTDLALAQLLLDRGATPDADTIYGSSVLADAISRRRLDVARLLLDHGAEGGRTDLYGQPLLICVIKDAAIQGADKTDLARRLLENGASANAVDMTWHHPAICLALEAGFADVVELLLEHGAETKHRTSSGATLLLHAVDHGRLDELKALLEHAADANEADRQGRTPLMQAVLRQDVEMVRLLTEHGAAVDASVTVLARAPGRPDVMELPGLGGRTSSAPAGGPRAGAPDAGRTGRPESPPPGYDVATLSP